MQKLLAVPSKNADNHRSLLEPIVRASHPDLLLLTGGSLEQPRVARIRSPRRLACTEASVGTQGTVGLGAGPWLLPLLTRCTRERGSALTDVLPEHLLPQPRTPGAGCGSDATALLSHPAPPAPPRPGASTRDPPTSRRPRRRPARGSALPGAARSRKPEAAGDCQTQGRCPAEPPASALGLPGRVVRQVFLGKPPLRHSFILLPASGCSLK